MGGMGLGDGNFPVTSLIKVNIPPPPPGLLSLSIKNNLSSTVEGALVLIIAL